MTSHKALKILLIIFSVVVLFCSAAFLSSLYYLSYRLNQPISYLTKTAYSTLNDKDINNKKNINFLILGLDKRNDRLEKTETTDTIIISSLNLQNGQIKLMSLPRDLWDYEQNTKINGLYPMALQNKDKFGFLQTSFSRLTGITIDKTLIITTDNLIGFVKVIGGVDVFLDHGFTDHKYPNPEYISNPKAPVYMTVSYPDGWNHLDASNITPFVRSRKSAETAAQGGTDIGRIIRQQLLIEAILKKIKTDDFLVNRNNLFGLYNFWHSQIETNLSDQDMLGVVLLLRRQLGNISLNKVELPIGENEKDGQIYHPDKFINKQWVYIPADREYRKLHQFFQDNTK